MCETPRVDRQIHTAGSPCKTGNTDAFPLCPGGESNPTPSLITPGQTHHNKAHEIIKNMTNSAHILHDIFITWNTAPKPQERETTPLATHRRAVQLLDDVEDIVIRLADDTPAASVYQKHFPTWAAFIYNYPYNWQSKNTINENSLDQLYTLSIIADRYTPNIDTDTFDQFRNYLDKVEAKLAKEPELPATTRKTTHLLIDHIRDVLDHYDQWGPTQLDKAWKQFTGQLVVVANTSADQATWKTLLNQLVIPYAVNQLPGVLTIGAVLGITN